MAKKKKHWSVILKVLGACRSGMRYAKGKRSLETLWRDCKHGDWLEWLCESIANYWKRQCFMCVPGFPGEATSVKARRYYNEFPDDAPSDASDVRKYWPKPPRIPKKLLKAAGLA